MKQSERRQAARGEVSTYNDKEKLEMERAAQREEERQQKELERQEEIKDSSAYKLVAGLATVMDRWLLDPILNIFLPEIGGYISAFSVGPSLYVSVCVVRSLPLTLAMIYNVMLDTLISSVPFIGWVIDFCDRANIKNYTLITGYVEGDKEIVRSVRKRAVWCAIWIIIMIYLLYLLFKLCYRFVVWSIGIIHSCIDFFVGLF